jgi:hypothetical protein
MSAEQPSIESFEALLILENWALASTGATCSASSTADTSGDPLTEMTADSLLNEDLSQAWRSGVISSGSTVSVTWTFDRPRPVDWVSLHRSNIRVPWKVELKSMLGASLVVSPWTEPVIRASLSDFPWESMLWTLGPDDDWLETATDEFRLDSFITFPVGAYPNVGSVVATFDISGHTNAGRAFLQFALPMIATRFRPSINMPTGWAMPPVSRSEVVRTETGAKLGRYRPMQRTATFDLPLLGPDSPDQGRIEVFRKLLTRFLMTRGDLARVFFWPEPKQRHLFYDTAFVGCIEAPPRPQMTQLEWAGITGFNLQETN